ncbi:uncharacterized protein LOC131157823 [Malania oleifera]|uniref:uncharacterized protein LOC131157823 n=1 Tax=Malania oleifera TaxID=397392 RepID=UPI0025ADF414|nr:uncharacterized protein LOC131157823 [Malania oleifera]
MSALSKDLWLPRDVLICGCLKGFSSMQKAGVRFVKMIANHGNGAVTVILCRESFLPYSRFFLSPTGWVCQIGIHCSYTYGHGAMQNIQDICWKMPIYGLISKLPVELI